MSKRFLPHLLALALKSGPALITKGQEIDESHAAENVRRTA